MSDYDLSTGRGIQDARATLDALQAHAAIEEATGFDPSASSGVQDDTSTGTQATSERAQSWNGELASRSDDTDLTSTSHSLSLLALDPGYSGAEIEESERFPSTHYDMGLEKLDVESKERVLHEMFPSVKKFRISYTLKKSGENLGRAVEELLSRVFFEEEQGEVGVLLKGVDGFVEDSVGRRGRQGKGKKKKQLRNGRRASSTPAQLTDVNTEEGISTWEAARRDVEFICQRTGLPMQTVSSHYHAHGASMPATVGALLEMASSEVSTTALDELTVQTHASELGGDFPTISMFHLTALIRLTYPSTSSAHELATILTAKPFRSKQLGGIEIITKYSTIDLNETGLSSPVKRSAAKNLRLDLSTATALAATNTLARQTAFNQASAAYRKSKSDPLMGAAAGYYSSIGRDHDAIAKKYSAAAADALVTSQSTRLDLDLHGVGVKDAIRIARERVTAWWAALKDTEPGSAPKGGFRIVTGMGKHSEGGRGKLGPAVGKMLVREGWKVEIGEGVLVVRGVARRL